MPRENIRSSVQIIAMVLIVGLAAVTGWACGCGSGSDHPPYEQVTRDYAIAAGVLDRWHDFYTENITATTKDLNYLREWTERGQPGVGLLLPQAPGSSQPGTLSGDNSQIFVSFVADGQPVYFPIPLITDTVMAANLESMSPAPDGMQWQALVPANTDWLTQIPTQTASFEDINGSLYYQVNFHGSELCAHCEVKMTGCSTAELSFSEQIGLWAFGQDKFMQSDELVCNAPISTYIIPTDFMGYLLPGGPLIASFGFWGGSTYTTTLTSQVGLQMNLNHTAVATETFNLAPITSEQGWKYTWTDLSGTPITQLDVGPLTSPLYMTYQPNLRLAGSDLPTCVRMQDTLHLTATLVTTPTVVAATTTMVQVLPDPAVCSVADVGIVQSASAAALNAGDWVTFTLTITNFEAAPVSVAVTDTLSSAVAIGSVALPAGCTRNGATITCAVAGLPAGSSVELSIAVQVSPYFTGVLANRAWAEPEGATDNRFYDNATGPVAVNVTGGIALRQLFLPLVKH